MVLLEAVSRAKFNLNFLLYKASFQMKLAFFKYLLGIFEFKLNNDIKETKLYLFYFLIMIYSF